MRRSPAAVLLALAALAAGCGGGAVARHEEPAAVSARPARPCGVPGRPGTAEVAPQPGAPQVVVRIPPAARVRGRRLALVLVLHYTRGTGADMEALTGMDATADRHGFVAAYPTTAAPSGSWSLPTGSSQAGRDVALLRATIAAVGRMTCLDSGRVVATGFSNGGRMAAIAGCAMARGLRAIVVVSGGLGKLPPCRPARPISVVVVHGTGDVIAPYRGRGASHDGAVMPYVQAWARRDGCAGTPRVGPARRGVVRLSWGRCAAGTVVEHLRVRGGAHAWPPGDEPPGVTLDASALVWRTLARAR